VSRSTFIQDVIGLGPQWQARQGWFADHPAEQLRQQQSETANTAPAAFAASFAIESAPQEAVHHSELLSQPVDQGPVLAIGSPDKTEAQLPTSPSPIPVIGKMSWDELEQHVARCEQCQLCQTRSHTVFGRGNPQARWMLIGEAPGEQEDKQGLPFVGKAGQLLDNMLAAAGLDRDRDVYIANVLKCRPPGNRNPAPQEILACQDYLLQQIRHVQPTLILALGRFAVQTLLQTEQSIGKLRGQLHQYQGIPLIATYHPAYLLRNLPDKAKAWQDMVLAKRQFARLSQQDQARSESISTQK